MHKAVSFSCLLLLAAAAVARAQSAPPAQAPPPAAPAATFGEVVKATAVTVTIDVRDAQGRVPADLAAKDFSVLEDERPMPVISVERIGAAAASAPPEAAPPAAGSPPAGVPAAVEAEAWQIVVYFDSPTASTPTVQGAARELAARAAELVRLGLVEVVLADPRPTRVVAPTRDAAALAAGLEKLAKKGKGDNQIARLRRDFVSASDADNLEELNRGARAESQAPRQGGGGTPGSPGSVLYRNEGARPPAGSGMPSGASGAQRQMLIRNSVQQEGQLLARSRALLVDWLALSERSRRPRALLLVSDGFDVDPGEFYLSYLRDTSLASGLESELAKMSAGPAFEQMTRTIAASGWQVVAISLGQPGAQSATSAEQSGRGRFRGFTGGGTGSSEATGTGLSAFLLRAPAGPLRTAAEETGGELALAPAQLGAAVTALGERVRLTYQVPRDPDGAVHRLAVRAERAGLTVRAPRSVSAAAPDALMAARARHVLDGPRVEGASFPVTLRAAGRPDPAKPDAVDLTLELAADLAPLAAEGARLDAGNLRVTIAVEMPDGRILISQERPRPRDLSADRRYASSTPLRVPKGVRRIAVAVDDVESGAWGAASAVPNG